MSDILVCCAVGAENPGGLKRVNGDGEIIWSKDLKTSGIAVEICPTSGDIYVSHYLNTDNVNMRRISATTGEDVWAVGSLYASSAIYGIDAQVEFDKDWFWVSGTNLQGDVSLFSNPCIAKHSKTNGSMIQRGPNSGADSLRYSLCIREKRNTTNDNSGSALVYWSSPDSIRWRQAVADSDLTTYNQYIRYGRMRSMVHHGDPTDGGRGTSLYYSKTHHSSQAWNTGRHEGGTLHSHGTTNNTCYNIASQYKSSDLSELIVPHGQTGISFSFTIYNPLSGSPSGQNVFQYSPPGGPIGRCGGYDTDTDEYFLGHQADSNGKHITKTDNTGSVIWTLDVGGNPTSMVSLGSEDAPGANASSSGGAAHLAFFSGCR